MTDHRLGRYQLMNRLGAGGMAEVWLADQTGPRGFRRRCVIKRIHDHLNAQQDFVARFEDEARLAAMLRHPNIVRVEDFGEEDGTLFMALEYIEGWEFADLLRRGAKSGQKIPDTLALDIIIQIAEALDYAHALRDQSGRRLRIVHRDVSPQNLLIEKGTGSAKLLDFGIASAESNLHETQAGLIKGKIAYFSPEQARGEPLDGRTDLYALGLVLYEALAGKRVFRGESMVRLLREVTDAQVPPLSGKRPDLPREVLVAVAKATAEDREARYATGAAMAAALRHALQAMGGITSRSAMDEWVRTLPSSTELPKTGTTSAVSVMADSQPAPRPFEDDEPTMSLGKAAEATVASMRTPAQTVIAEPLRQRASSIRQDEPTVVAEPEPTEEVTMGQLSHAPPAVPTKPVSASPAGRSNVAWVATVTVGSLAVAVIAFLLHSAQVEAPVDAVDAPMRAVAPSPDDIVEIVARPDTGAPASADAAAAPEVTKPAPEPAEPQAAPAPQRTRPANPVKPKPKPKARAAPPRAVAPVKKAPAPKAQPKPARAPAPATQTAGLAQRDLDAVTMRNFQALANCKQGESGVVINLQIHKTGMPFGVRITGASSEVSTCLRKLVRKWRYPAHGGSAVRHKIKL